MAIRTVDCPECEAPVPYGRLSCTSCGSLLASIAGVPPRVAPLRWGGVGDPPPVPVDDPDPSADEVVPAGAPADTDDAAEPAPPEVELPPEAEPPDPADARWPPPVLAAPPGPPAPGPPSPAIPVPAGSWLPPSAAFGDSVPNGAVAGNPMAVAVPSAAAVRRPVLAAARLDAPVELSGWLVAVGSSIAVAGFLLPWAAAVPFTRGLEYTDRWGFAIASHLLLFGGALALLVLAILPNPLPGWLRNGALPLALGGLLLGIVWPYVFGGIGSQIGSLGVALAAGLLLVGGSLGVRPQRHGRPEPAV